MTKSYYTDLTYFDGELLSFSVEDQKQSSISHTISILTDCTVSEKAAKQEVDTYIQNSQNLLRKACIDDKIGNEYLGKVLVRSLRSSSTWNRIKTLKNIKKTILLEKFCEPSFTLIKANKKFYYMPLDEYIIERRRSVRLSYYNAIDKFLHRDFNVSYDKNGRLYSNICHMPSILLKHITYQGQPFVEVDLKNAQWTFLAYCISNSDLDNKISQCVADLKINIDTPDMDRFFNSVYQGTFYSTIQDALGMKTREEAKTATFELLFGRNSKHDSDSKSKLRNLYPTLIQICDAVKTAKGNNYKTLSNELQKVESSIIIDDILYYLHDSKLPILSKHDSFLIPIDIYDEVISMIIYKLNEVLGINKYTIKTYSP